MTPLTDDELQRNLSRRVNRQPLSLDDRRELLTSVSAAARGRRRPIYLFGWPFARVASAAAAVLVLAMVGSLLLPGLARLPGPGGVPEPTSPAPSSVASSQPPDSIALRIYTAAEASEMAADPANEGRVVIVALDPRWPCPGDVSCADAGFIVVRLEGDAALIGGVTLLDGAEAWTVSDAPRYRGGDPGLVPIEGWLGRANVHPCPSPARVFDERFGCGQESYLSPSADGARSGDGALRVQDGAYEQFAEMPLIDSDGWAARRGIYLAQPAGLCRGVGPPSACGLWELVARIEPPQVSPSEPSPSPAAATQDGILGAVAEWLGGEEWPLDGFVYVHSNVEEIGFLLNTYGPGAREPDLREVGPPLFEGPMTDASKQAIAAALQPIVIQFVEGSEELRQPRTSPGICAAFVGGRFLIEIGSPRPSAASDGYFVTVQLGNGCQGWTRVLEVAQVDGDYRVTRVVLDGFFIID